MARQSTVIGLGGTRCTIGVRGDATPFLDAGSTSILATRDDSAIIPAATGAKPQPTRAKSTLR